jgi:diguanylate cyclase (GGDEF)-like protein
LPSHTARIGSTAGKPRTRFVFAALLAALALVAPALWASGPLTRRIAHDSQTFPQFFAIEQASDRLLYVGSKNAILRHDGQRWLRLEVPRPGPVRQLQRDSHGRLWAGGSGWFGYLERQADGSDRVIDVSGQFDDVLGPARFPDTWGIIESPQGLVFRSLRELFVIDPLSGKRTGYFQHQGRFGAVFVFAGELLIQRRDDGLYRLVAGKLERFSEDPFFGQHMLIDAIELNAQSFLAVDRRPGLVIVENGQHREAPFLADAALHLRLQHLLALRNGEIAIAGDDGILRIYDPTSGGLRQIALDTSFQSGLKHDLDGALLVLSDQAISRLHWPPVLENLADDSIGFGGVRRLIADDDRLLAVGYSGVFGARRTDDGAISPFARLPGADQDVWNLLVDDDALLFAEAHALYAYTEGKTSRIGPSDLYPRELLPSRFDPARLWIGTEVGLALAHKGVDGWRVLAHHDELNIRVTGITELAADALLVSSADRGLWRIDLDPQNGQLRQARALGPADGLSTGDVGETFLFEYQDQWFASTPQGFHVWQGDRFVGADMSGLAQLKRAGDTLRIVSDGRQGLLAFGYDSVYRRGEQGDWFLVPLEPTEGGVIDTLLAEADGGYVATSTGLIRYRYAAIAEDRKPGALRLSRISFEVPGQPARSLPLGDRLVLPAGKGSLNLELGLTDYGPGPPPSFQVRMQGLADEWTEWAPVASFHYAELGHGSYRFEARAQRGPGVIFGLPTVAIEKLPHWYQRSWVQALMAALILLGFARLISFRHRSQMRAMDRRHVELDAQVALRTEELAHANRLLRDLAELDGLTGVANRRRFDQVLSEWMAQAEAFPLALLFVDVDHFKEFNDRHGHLAGDAVLRDVAQQLAEVARSTILVARFGGEEFAVLCRDHQLDAATALAEQLRADIAVKAGGITVSIGVAMISAAADSQQPQDLIRRADAALYRAKANGRNRVEVAE